MVHLGDRVDSFTTCLRTLKLASEFYFRLNTHYDFGSSPYDVDTFSLLIAGTLVAEHARHPALRGVHCILDIKNIALFHETEEEM